MYILACIGNDVSEEGINTQFVISASSQSAEVLIQQAREMCDNHLKCSSINEAQYSTRKNKPRHLLEPGWVSYVETDYLRDDNDCPRNKRMASFSINNSVAMFWARSVKPFNIYTAEQFIANVKTAMEPIVSEEEYEQLKLKYPHMVPAQNEAEAILNELDVQNNDPARDKLTELAKEERYVDLLNTMLRRGVCSTLNETHMEDGHVVFAVIKV